MFASHKPKVYRSSTGCCICRSKSSSSRFGTTEKYENLFTACFGVEQGSRKGLICNACVLLIKRWQKLPEEKKGSLANVSDMFNAKCRLASLFNASVTFVRLWTKSVNCQGARGDLRLQTRRRERKLTKSRLKPIN